LGEEVGAGRIRPNPKGCQSEKIPTGTHAKTGMTGKCREKTPLEKDWKRTERRRVRA
jgi:hypothetical protein